MASRLHTLLPPMIAAAHQAGLRIMEDWQQGGAVTRKADGSPVTLTDQAAEAIVLSAIRAISPHPIIAEEQASAGDSPAIAGTFWLVDALDGTRAFVRGNPEFTVNIALIEDGHPTLGVIFAPVMGVTWHAIHGAGAYRQNTDGQTRIAMRDVPDEGFHLLAGSRASEPVITEPFIGPHTVAKREQRSSSLKFCLLAEGEADLYPRLGPTYEWDTAAGDIILREAGGAVLDLKTREPIRYGKSETNFENEGFIAGSRAALRLSKL